MTPAPTFNTWVTCPRPNPQARLRLFCFPFAGGGASAFYAWSADLPSDIEVCPVRFPGRENLLKEPPYTRLVPLIEKLSEALHPFLDKPFAFFGHSLGALISFELARHLRRHYARTPRCLFVSGSRAPQLPDPNRPIHQLPYGEFVDELRRLKGTPAIVLENAELMQMVLPSLRADFAILETYVYTPEESLACPIIAFGGLQDEIVSHEQLLAWRTQTRSSFRLHMLGGDHFFLQNNRSLLLQHLSQELNSLPAK